MSTLALSLKLSAIKTLSAVQRAINILKSAGPGAWYDPSDIASYTVTGPELVTDGTFDTGTAGWISAGGAHTWTGSALRRTIGQGDAGSYSDVGGFVVGKTYRLTASISNTTLPNGVVVNAYAGAAFSPVIGSISPAAPTPLVFVATSTVVRLYLYCNNTSAADFDNISARELPNISACTMFQDSTGTTPVTAVEQPVGLMLDKSQGLVLGAELVPSLDFATWPSTAVTAKSGGSFTTSTSGGCWFTVPGWTSTKSYKLRLVGTCPNTWNLRNADNGLNITSVSAGAFDLNIPLTSVLQSSTAGNLYFQVIGAGTFTVTSVSLKELPGNHLIQPTATSRPTLSSRYNLLTKTEQFDDAYWVKFRLDVSANATTAPDGAQTADTLIADTTDSTGHSAYATQTFASVGYVLSVYAKNAGQRYLAINYFDGSHKTSVFDTQTGLVTQQTGATATMQDVGDGWYRCSIAFTPAAGIGYCYFVPITAATWVYGVNSYTGDGTSGIYIWGASLVPASDAALPYQRVNTATDYDYDFSKFPPFLRFDGVDDSLYTAASVDFTSTDKMTVFAGVHKASDVAAGILVESSSAPNSTAGTFTVQAPVGAGLASFGIYNAGTTQRGADVSGATYAAPSTRVLTGVGDISGDLVALRLNGTQAASAATDQGTGNYGNHVLYVGSRNNASFPFSGRIYQLAIKGKSLSAGEVSTLESYINSKTKAF